MPNLVQDPSLEIPEPNPYWVMETDCPIQGASITIARFHTGIRSLRINSRNTGPTCGRARQTLSGFELGRDYFVSIWWNAQGISTGKNARIAVGGVLLGTIIGITVLSNPWVQFVCPTLYHATGPIADLTIDQLPGSGSIVFSRYFDDVTVEPFSAPDAAAPSSLAGRAAASDPSSQSGILASPEEVRATARSLALGATPSALAVRAAVSKPPI